MTGRIIPFEKAKDFLDKMFSTFPNGEKYFVDLSGKGEPLMNLPVILKIAKYCQDKSDELNVEVLPTFVCNGTLLSPIVAEILQKSGILFGVSLDGDKETHDLYRKDKNGEGTYSEIIHNVLQIKNREYIGCTGTLTNRVFDLKSSVVSLSKIFKTICFKPVRGKEYGFTEESEKAWKENTMIVFFNFLNEKAKVTFNNLCSNVISVSPPLRFNRTSMNLDVLFLITY